MNENKELCNCRFQICDMGYYECNLEKGHSGNHVFNNKGTESSRKYEVSWEPNDKLDIIIDIDWFNKNTNVKSVIKELVNSIDILEEIEYKEIFDDPLYGSDTSIYFYIKLKQSLYQDLKDKEFNTLYDLISEKVNHREENYDFDYFILSKILDKLDIEVQDYSLHINAELDWRDYDKKIKVID